MDLPKYIYKQVFHLLFQHTLRGKGAAISQEHTYRPLSGTATSGRAVDTTEHNDTVYLVRPTRLG
jgi:hypothetical protein